MPCISIRIVPSACVFAILTLAQSALGQVWTQLSPSGAPPAARGSSTGVYDPASNRMIIFGGRDASGNNRNDVWVLADADGVGSNPSRWIRLIADDAAGSPPARSGHSAVYDSVNNRMIIFGGCSGACAPVLNDVWVLSNANGIGGTPAWAQLEVPAGPAARTNAAAGYDAANNELVVFGGQDGSDNPCSTFSDIWVLQFANGLGGTAVWLEAQSNPAIPAGQNGVAAAESGAALSLFGGTGTVNGTCTVTNTLSIFVVPEFFVVGTSVPQGAVPPARSFASLVADTVSGQNLLFGGVDTSGNYLNDAWNFYGGWSQIVPKSSLPTGRSGHAAVLDSVHQRMIIFGGNTASGVLNDTWVLHAPELSELTCVAFTGVPTLLRAEGISEQTNDLVLNCSGGAPTPEGEAIPEYTISLTLDTNVTGSLLPEAAGLSEALLTIDEPFPANPVPSSAAREPGAPPQILCMPLGSTCGATGTGGTPSPYQTQPNVFVGKQANASELYWRVPIDPPGANATRRIRLTNVRANASQLPVSTGLIPTMVQATVAIQGAPAIPLAGPQEQLANILPGIVSGVTSNSSVPQCQPHNAVLLGGSGTAAFDFSVQVQEGFAQAFQYRNYGTTLYGPVFPPTLVEQNVFGINYLTETGIYSPSLFTSAPTLGLASFGTRILVSLGSVSEGTHLFVPTTITMTGNYGDGEAPGELQLVKANENGNSEAGYEPVASTAMIGTTPVAEAYASGSTVYAVYEVIYSNPSVQETATIPVAVAFITEPSVGVVNATTSLAPLSTVGTASETAAIPRFANFSTPQEAFTITSCASQP
jgi:Galactose oxidase, central domain/Kelch motif